MNRKIFIYGMGILIVFLGMFSFMFSFQYFLFDFYGSYYICAECLPGTTLIQRDFHGEKDEPLGIVFFTTILVLE